MDEIIDKLREVSALLNNETLGEQDAAEQRKDDIVWEQEAPRTAKLALLNAAQRKVTEALRLMEVCNE